MDPDSGDDAIIEEVEDVEDVVELDPASLYALSQAPPTEDASLYALSQADIPTEDDEADDQADEDQELDPDQEAIQAVDTLVQESLSTTVTPARYLQILHELATFIENLEIEYASTSGNSYGAFDEDVRDDYRIGLILDSLNNHEVFLDSVLGRLVGAERNTTDDQEHMLAASYRLLIACSVGPNSTAVSYAAEDSVVDVLLSLVKNSAPPVRCYAVGLLSVSLLERKVADRVVRQQIPQLLLQNLVDSNVAERGYFPRSFDRKSEGSNVGVVGVSSSTPSVVSSSSSSPSSSSSSSSPTTSTTTASSSSPDQTASTIGPGELLFDTLGPAVSPVSMATLMRLECNWTLQCLASMGEYQETLAPATHTGALDTVLNIFRSEHDSIHLDAVELVRVLFFLFLMVNAKREQHNSVFCSHFMCSYSPFPLFCHFFLSHSLPLPPHSCTDVAHAGT